MRARVWQKLDMLVVQDIFLTETAYLADVVLPTSAWPGESRYRDQYRPHGAIGPSRVGYAWRRAPDLWIIQQMAQRLGLDWNYAGEERVWLPSMRKCTSRRIRFQRHQLGEIESRVGCHLPAQGRQRPPASRWYSSTSSRPPTGAPSSCLRHHPRQRAARCRINLWCLITGRGRTLAHRLHDPPCLGARCH